MAARRADGGRHAGRFRAEPDRFTATFGPAGLVNLRADCNRCAGGYAAQAESPKVTPMACTRAACPSAPLDTQFATIVGAATAWSATNETLELKSAGTVRFKR